MEALLVHHRATGAALTIGLVEVEDPSSFGIVGLGATNDGEVDGDLRQGFVRRFAEKPSPEEAFSRLINAGVYVIEPEALAMVPPQRSMTSAATSSCHARSRSSHCRIDVGRPVV